MKTALSILALAAVTLHAQQTVYTALYSPAGGAPVSVCVTTNDGAMLTAITGSGATVTGLTPLGPVKMNAGVYYSGFTNIVLTNGGVAFCYGSLQVTHPATPCTVSNYVPADAIVIPAAQTGNVNIILESSPDLVNWTAASPGTYSAATGTNRFFRVRAAVQ